MTSVGQLCPDDRKARRPVNYQVSARDVIIGGLVGLLASALVALPLTIFTRGFFGLIIIFMAGPAIAEFIVRVVDRVTKLKRGRPMQITVAVAIVLGTLPFALVNWWMFLYMALAVATAVARLHSDGLRARAHRKTTTLTMIPTSSSLLRATPSLRMQRCRQTGENANAGAVWVRWRAGIPRLCVER
jgi:uncharacterized membrane protein YeaQ/YmgE (transglycosylase-associated protein family)